MKKETLFEELSDELNTLKQNHLYRELRVLDHIRDTRAAINGKEMMLFCGNDYLGLSKHPLVVAAFEQAAKKYGVGAGASRLISGTSDLAKQLEEHLAAFKRKERALVFTTGYLANLGIISSLCDQQDLVIVDKLNHASIVDACKLSRAKLRVYPHKDVAYLEKILKQARNKFRRVLIITDSVFSMDGDLAPLREIVALKERYGALLMIDEAHGTGVFGESGRGVSELLDVEDAIDISMGTLSKAIGTLGGFVAGKSDLVEYFINKSRPFIFATALPPAILAASLKSLELIQNVHSLREQLWANIRKFYDGLKSINLEVPKEPSPIIPIVIGSEEKTLHVSKALFEKGFFVPAVRYPTVAKGKARLRITISGVHEAGEIERLISALEKTLEPLR